MNPVNSHCIYRGQVVEKVVCHDCISHPRIKVFECELHETCTIGKKIEGHKCCGDPVCQDFKPPG